MKFMSTIAALCVAASALLLSTGDAGVVAQPPLQPSATFRDDVVIRLRHADITPATLTLLAAADATDCSSSSACVDRWSLDMWRLPARLAATVRGRLDTAGVAYNVVVDDVQTLVDAEQRDMARARATATATKLAMRKRKTTMTTNDDAAAAAADVAATDAQFLSQYHTVDEINTFMHTLQQRYPHLVNIVTLGKTFEGRSIYAMQVTAPSSSAPSSFNHDAFKCRPHVYYEANIHAREWITSASLVYFMHALVTGAAAGDGSGSGSGSGSVRGAATPMNATSSQFATLVENLAYTLVPVVNVDGFVYSHTTNRMWRKTRSTYPSSNGCVGVDPNRNWDDHWCEVGASPDPCTDDYCGPKADSERCVAAVQKYVRAMPNTRAFIDFHSFSQLWMQPYGWERAPPLKADHDAQQAMGVAIVAAVKSVHGTVFRDGDIARIIYPASGSSADWAYDTGNAAKPYVIRYSYGVELRDTGEYGFVLPAREIVPQGEELTAGLLVMGSMLIKEYGARGSGDRDGLC